MANYFLDGPDELAKMEFISRQQLLMEDRIMRDKINNYVQLVHALTGREVIMPINDDAYSFVSVSSDEYEEIGEDETIVYVEEVLSEDDDGLLLESKDSQDPVEEPIKFENLEIITTTTDIPGPPVDVAPPPTPSQIIRKLKATLVEAGMCQIRNTKRKSKRLGGNNWSYDMAKRRLDRELRRIQKRRAYRDAIERLPELTRQMHQAADEKGKENVDNNNDDKGPGITFTDPDDMAPMQEAGEPSGENNNNSNAQRGGGCGAVHPQPHALERQMSRRGSLSGSIFAGLLRTLESSSKKLSDSVTPTERSQQNARIYRSDQRLQAILKKHQSNLKEEKEKIYNSYSDLPPPEREAR